MSWLPAFVDTMIYNTEYQAPLLYVYKTSESCNYDSQRDMRCNGGLHWWEKENACVSFDSGIGYVT